MSTETGGPGAVEPGAGPEPIAVVGMALRVPGATDVATFWRHLCDGVESIEPVPESRLLAAGVDRATLDDPRYVRASATLEGIERFDAALFGYRPREAEVLDPAHRFFLEAAWEALESAGHDPRGLPGRVGVFAGSGQSTYLIHHILSRPELIRLLGGFEVSMATDKDFLPTRVSYALGLTGPSVGVNTACSSSLVAVHLACQSLLTYQADAALAGGATIRVPQGLGYLHLEGGIASPDGHCRAFDARAAGTVEASGVGVVVLRRLADARRDGDPIRAVILGSAVNNDGALKVGFTAPGVDGQAAVVAEALAVAGVPADSIGYVEAHGTGTPLGDPVEVEALTRAFRATTARAGYCALGSVKTNVGHLDTAAGVVGLIKAILALRHRAIPPSLHFERPNPRIDFGSTPFRVATSLQPWAAGPSPRRAGVSSFGIGGTNAHVVLEEAPPSGAPPPPDAPGEAHLLVLSARTPALLETATDRLAGWLAGEPRSALADVAFTLSAGRHPFGCRRALVAGDPADAARALAARTGKRLLDGTLERDRPAPTVAFLFPGQGAQAVGSGRALYEGEPRFREWIDRAAERLGPGLGLDLRTVLYPPDGGREAAQRRLTHTLLAQPALFAVEHALARLWMAWGIVPWAAAGHSVGEYVAACLAGTLTFEDALDLVALRGRLVAATPPGAMLAVALPEADLAALLGPGLAVAALNGPGLTVASGPEPGIAALEERLSTRGVPCRRLRTSHAFHSPLMDAAVAPLADAVARVARRPPRWPWVSGLTGTFITATEATSPTYWARHLREPVRFGQALQTLRDRADVILLEVGPGTTLTGLASRGPLRPGFRPALSSLGRDLAGESRHLAGTLGALWVAGVPVDWDAVHERPGRRRLVLPASPFEHRRYWLDPPAPGLTAVTRAAAAGDADSARSAGRDVAAWLAVPTWSLVPPPAPEAWAGRWLVLADAGGLGEALVERLRKAGRPVVLTPASTAGPALEALVAGAEGPARIVHLGTLDPLPEDGPGRVRAALASGFHSLVHLGQALGRRAGPGPFRIDVVTRGLHRVAGEPGLRPELATLLGPARTLPREDPRVICRCVDLDPDPGLDAVGVLEVVWQELRGQGDEPLVAWRAAERYRPGHRPAALPAPAGPGPRLRHRGVYLVTGGLGGVGLSVAGWLAGALAARLVLVSRSVPPPDDPRLRALAAAGAEVLALPGDVADLGRMREVLDRARARFGHLDGVIHAAGVADGGVIQRRTPEDLEAVLAPKVHGTRVLDTLLADEPPTFVVLCSSLASLEGSAGQVAYVAANAYLDAVAQARSGAERPFTVSVNWDAWAEVGMAVRAQRSLAAAGRAATHPWLGRATVDGTRRRYVALLSEGDWVLAEHRWQGRPLLPATAYLELMVAAYLEWTGGATAEVEDLYLGVPLTLDGEGAREVHTIVEGPGPRVVITIRSRGADGVLVDHASATVGPLAAPLDVDGRPRLDDPALLAGDGPPLPALDREGDGAGLRTGPRWRTLTRLRTGPGWALALHELATPFREEAARFHLHPALLDGALNLLAGTLEDHQTALPFRIRRLRYGAALPPRLLARVRRRAGEGGEPTFDVTLADEAGRPLVEVEGYQLRRPAGGRGEPRRPDGLPPGENWALRLADAGIVRRLEWHPRGRRAPGPGEVEIEVGAAGLNFKEVLAATGIVGVPLSAEGLGLECAGRVARVGAGVETLSTGEAVVAFADAAFARFVTTPEALVLPAPAGLGVEAAAGLPVAFTTAYHALVELGRLGPGERVLIHAAAGGVGLAAVQIARWRGAEVLATAGTVAKRAYLASLGVAHVFDSRTAAFVDGVLAATGGRGVDVVLNSLAGELLRRSLDVLAPFGRFLELGRRDIEEDTPLGLRVFERGLSFAAVAIGPEMPGFRHAFGAAMALVRSGVLAPLPTRSFPYGEAAAAFAHMAQARHVGKVVLVPPGDPAPGAGATGRREVRREPSLPGWIRPAEGVEALRRILAAGHPQVLVSPALAPGGADAPPTPTGLPPAPAEIPGPPVGGGHPRPALGTPFVAPRHETERAVAALWGTLLGLREVGIHDDFFELGGNSLLGVQLAAELRHRLGVDLPIGAIFEAPTVERLSQAVEARRGREGEPAAGEPGEPVGELRPRAPASGPAPLSFAQEGLWFLDQLWGGSAAYNLPGHLALGGALDIPALVRAVEALVERHAILRTALTLREGRPVQEVGPAPPRLLPGIDLAGLPSGTRSAALREVARRLVGSPIDLAAGQPFRLALVRLEPEAHVLLLVVHHAAADGWSMGILVQELLLLYAAHAARRPSPLAPLRLGYADYAAWQRQAGSAGEVDRRLARWQRRLAGAPLTLELPGGRTRRAGVDPRGHRTPLRLGAEPTASLRALGAETGATLFAILLAAFAAVLARYCGRTDIVVGSPVAGRPHRDLEGVVGLFVNTLPLRVDAGGNPTFRELLARSRSAVREALADQDVPFGRLVEALRPPRDPARNPLVQVLLALQNVPLDSTPAGAGGLPGLAVEPFEPDPIPTAFDLMLTVLDGPDGLHGTLIYHEDALDAPTAQGLVADLARTLAAMAADPDRRALEIPLGEGGDAHGPAPTPGARERFDFDALAGSP